MKSIITLLIALCLAAIVCPLMVCYGLFLVVKYQLSELMVKPNLKAFLYASILWLALILLWRLLVQVI